MLQETVISRIRLGWAVGASCDDLYDRLVLTDEIDEGTFFLCYAAASLLDKDAQC